MRYGRFTETEAYAGTPAGLKSGVTFARVRWSVLNAFAGTHRGSNEQTGLVKRPRLRTPFARAVVPVAAGLVFFALLFGVTWLLAGVATDRRQTTPSPGDYTFEVGPVEAIADIIERDGPVLYPDLRDTDYQRSVVVDHIGDDPTRGWQVYYAYPADREPTCLVEHVIGTRQFTDCEGRTLEVEALHRPVDARPIVENRTNLLLDLRTLDS